MVFIPGVYTEFGHRMLDKRRIVNSIIASSKTVQALRKEKQIRQAKSVDCLQAEYIPGGF